MSTITSSRRVELDYAWGSIIFNIFQQFVNGTSIWIKVIDKPVHFTEFKLILIIGFLIFRKLLYTFRSHCLTLIVIQAQQKNKDFGRCFFNLDNGH